MHRKAVGVQLVEDGAQVSDGKDEVGLLRVAHQLCILLSTQGSLACRKTRPLQNTGGAPDLGEHAKAWQDHCCAAATKPD